MAERNPSISVQPAGVSATSRPAKSGKTERLIIEELGCQLGLMICENNRLLYSIDQKNKRATQIVERLREADIPKAELLELLGQLIDGHQDAAHHNTAGPQFGLGGAIAQNVTPIPTIPK